jgi:nucleoside-diphosphate-sugar epimerase
MDLVVNFLTARAHSTGKITVFGGDQFRPLLHVKDAARAIVAQINTAHGGVFNLLRQNTRIIDLAYQIRTHYPDLVLEKTDALFQDTRNYRVSARRAKEVLGFVPTYTVDHGIEELKHLMETKRIKNFSDIRYSNHLFLKDVLARNSHQ